MWAARFIRDRSENWHETGSSGGLPVLAQGDVFAGICKQCLLELLSDDLLSVRASPDQSLQCTLMLVGLTHWLESITTISLSLSPFWSITLTKFLPTNPAPHAITIFI